MSFKRTNFHILLTLLCDLLKTRNMRKTKENKMTKMYKVIFNNHEVLVAEKKLNKHKVVQAKKVTNKNRSELHVIANDVRDCLKKANEVFFKQFNFNAKSIEVSSPITNQVSKDLLEFAKTSNSMITKYYDQKASA